MFDLQVTDGVATLLLDRAPVNAMSDAWVAGFHALLDGLDARDDWSVLHIRSTLKVFAAGADRKEMRERFASADGLDRQIAAVRGYQRLFARIEAHASARHYKVMAFPFFCFHQLKGGTGSGSSMRMGKRSSKPGSF